MQFQDIYKNESAPYETVLRHFNSNQKLLHTFVLKFPNDAVYPSLLNDMQEKDYDAALNSAHSLKGICANLGFSRLSDAAAVMVRFFRAKQIEDAVRQFENVTREYVNIVNLIQQIEN